MKSRPEKESTNLLLVEAPTIDPVKNLHPLIDDYLSTIHRDLVGFVSQESIPFYMNETAFWIEHKVTDLLNYGMSAEEASKQVLSQSTPAHEVANKIIEESYEDAIDSPLYNKIGRANSTAAALFGIGNALYLALIQFTLYFPSSHENFIPISPAVVRAVFPQPLPYPEYSWQFFSTVSYPLITPFLMGWIAGRLIPRGATRAIYNVMFPILISAYLAGVLLLPSTAGLLYGVFQTIYGLPVGCAAAYISSSLHIRSLRKKSEGNGSYPPPPRSLRRLFLK